MAEPHFTLTADPANWLMSGAILAAWLLASIYWLRRQPREDASSANCLVIFASQTGQAEDIARQTHRRVENILSAKGLSSTVLSADEFTRDVLARADTVFFVVSTTGEGEAPDNARRFERDVMGQPANLSGKRVAVLALGDRRYDQFCGFGVRVARWAEAAGANLASDAICVDDLSPEDLARWDGLLLAEGFPQIGSTPDPVHHAWKIVSRDRVAAASPDPRPNHGNAGLFHLVLRSEAEAKPTWEIGDLFELQLPGGHVREYSIANRPGGNELHLFVRRIVSGGQAGRGSGLLTGADVGASNIPGRIRDHASFRPPAGTGPVLAIGAGSGWGGLRPHILDAVAKERPCWLIFGERSSPENCELLREMRLWEGAGNLQRLDLAMSLGGGPYVQDIVLGEAGRVREFLGQDGAIIICGRLEMGKVCLHRLEEILGQNWLASARKTGRIRHDLY